MRNVIARCAAAACAFAALFVVQAYQMHARRDIRPRRLRLYRHTAAADVPPSLLHGFLHESCYRLNDSLAERRRFLHRLAPRRDCGTDLCSAVRRARARWHESGTLVVTLAVWPEQRLLLESFAFRELSAIGGSHTALAACSAGSLLRCAPDKRRTHQRVHARPLERMAPWQLPCLPCAAERRTGAVIVSHR